MVRTLYSFLVSKVVYKSNSNLLEYFELYESFISLPVSLGEPQLCSDELSFSFPGQDDLCFKKLET